MVAFSPNLSVAYEELWNTVYVYIRSCGLCHADAQDRTQDAFLTLFDRSDAQDWLRESISPQHLGNRTKLLARRVLADAKRKERALKRQPPTWEGAVSPALSPDEALALKESCEAALAGMVQLGREMASRGQWKTYTVLKPYLVGESTETCETLARELAIKPANVRVQLCRMRRRLRALAELPTSQNPIPQTP